MNYTVKNLCKLFSSHPEGRWIMQWPNPQYLYDFVKSHEIKKVLDFGTGIGLSAAIIALALKDKGEKEYEIHTIEQFEKCCNIAKELIPKELQEHITFHLEKPTVWQTDLIPYEYFS